MPRRFDVLVEIRLPLAALRIATADVHPILATLHEALRVPPAILTKGNRRVLPRNARDDLLEQRLSQRGRRREHRFCVVVLRAQVAEHFGIAPIVRAHPEVGVVALDAMLGVGMRNLPRDGRARPLASSGRARLSRAAGEGEREQPEDRTAMHQLHAAESSRALRGTQQRTCARATRSGTPLE